MSSTVLTIARGETKTFRVYVKNPDGSAKDLTGMTAALVVKCKENTSEALDADVLFEISTTPFVDALATPAITAEDGVLEFYAVPAHTDDLEPKNYSCDIWVMNGGDRWQVLGPVQFRVTGRVKSTFA